MRVSTAVVAGLILVAAGCGGSSASVDGPRPEATIAAAPTSTPTQPPEELSLVQPDLKLVSDTGVLATAGETVVVDHVVHNAADTPRNVRFLVQGADVPIDLSLSSFRLDAGASFPVITTVSVPPDASPGDVFTFSMAAVQTDDVSLRAINEVRILVDDAEGERPVVLDTLADTETNENLTVYVYGAASDADDDLDASSLRVLGGGFVSAEVTARTDGTIRYTPFANVTGEDVVLYELCDHEGRCDSAMLTITVEDH